MSFEQLQYRSSPPAYSVTTPSRMENEIYIDGILHVDGKPVEQGKYCLKEREHKKNACGQLLRLIRSNFFL
jgi:hypothetical protein